jgi:hypothetical protein
MRRRRRSRTRPEAADARTAAHAGDLRRGLVRAPLADGLFDSHGVNPVAAGPDNHDARAYFAADAAPFAVSRTWITAMSSA